MGVSMVKTNREHLLEIGVIGEVTNASVEVPYTTSWDGKPAVSMGRGGIVYNVKPGDPCFGWAWGDKVEPGVSLDGVGNDNAKGSFRNFSCVGNAAKVVNGEAKGGSGVVVGKVGYIPGGGHHVVAHFDDGTLEKLAIGDKVQVRSAGVGLAFPDHPGVRAVGLSPHLMDGMVLEESKGNLVVPVVKVVPADYVGQGSGGSPSEASNWDLMTQSPDAVEYLKDLRLGDLVLLKDILSAWGRGYYEGGSTVGVVSCGASGRLGQGIGVTVILTSRGGEMLPKLDADANISKYLGLGGD